MRLTRLLMPVGLAALGWGCISTETVIRVKPDGSGVVTETVTIATEAVENAIALSGQAATKDQPFANVGLGPLTDPAVARARAATMGEGVTFVSADPIETEATRGLVVVYAFRDVSKLRVSQRPDSRLGLPATRPEQQVRFAFERSPRGTSVLTVHLRDLQVTPRPAHSPPPSPKPEISAATLAMAQQIFQGMRLRLAVELDGKIESSTSAWVEGSRVTLLDIDFGALTQDAAKLSQLRAATSGGSLENVHQLLKSTPGVRISLEPEVRIEFSGR